MEKVIIKTYADGEHIETFEFDCADRVKRAQSMLRTLKKILLSSLVLSTVFHVQMAQMLCIYRF